jgi:hypothetical protein
MEQNYNVNEDLRGEKKDILLHNCIEENNNVLAVIEGGEGYAPIVLMKLPPSYKEPAIFTELRNDLKKRGLL